MAMAQQPITRSELREELRHTMPLKQIWRMFEEISRR